MKLLTQAEAEVIQRFLGIDINKCLALQHRWEREGHRVIGFVLPTPELRLLGMRITFADIKEPTVELGCDG